MKDIINLYNNSNLILRIIIGLILGIILGLFLPNIGIIGTFGNLFVGSLKAIAPVLVFAIIVSSLTKGQKGYDSRFSLVIFLYIISTLLASWTAIGLSIIFPQNLVLDQNLNVEYIPSGIKDIIENLLYTMVANPVKTVMEGLYTGILFWAIVFGLALKKVASETTKQLLVDFSKMISQTVVWIINLAPFGIMGLVYSNVASNGLMIFSTYGKLILLLVGCMMFCMLVINPLIVFLTLRANPYPLLFRCLIKSGVTAFFFRSSAANIPVNMELCEKLGLDKELYSVSVPLGATINMNGAAVTISIMTLAAVHTIGTPLNIVSAIMLSVLGSIAACGASGVAGGSLLLIPMTCSIFGIPQDISMQVVAIGFIIGVIQDSFETAINSSGDVLFASTAEYKQWIKEGKSLPVFLGGTTQTEI